ncbi:MAG TPA: 1-acyl-sn-glycerol-3-phosphate acyltransferase [Myxococcaceae bacterium]|nr:1-acyl-sn-glycerol-3-phosphate acyltransferase [Myxococcaceae bacterium]
MTRAGGGPDPASVAITLVFALFVAVTAPLCVAIGFLLLVASWAVDPDRRLLHAFVCRWCVGYLHLNPFWRLHVEGRQRVPPGPAVLVANHQSMADIVAAMALFRSFKFVSKRSLFRVPLLGWMMSWIRHVPLDRGRPHSTRAMLEDCRGWLHRGVAVFFFPEATYGPRDRMLSFRPGAFLLAVEEHVPIVPVLIEGTRELLDGDGPWMAPRAQVKVTVLEPLMPPHAADADALAVQVQALYLARRV